METVRKTYQEKLRPTPAQERALEHVLWHCRTLYNTALAQRVFMWKQRGISLSRYSQEAELTTLRAEIPVYGDLRSHVLQDVLARLDTTYQAFFRRVAAGEKPAFRATRVGTPTTLSPIRSMATVPGSITAFSSSQRSVGSPYVGAGQLRAVSRR
jgi:putative transposase